MVFNQYYFSKILSMYRNQFKLDYSSLAFETGIDPFRLKHFENSDLVPTGDEILILADFFKCDYNFFISDSIIEPLDQTDALYRKFDDEFSIEDRWAIQELLYLAECEEYLQRELKTHTFYNFNFVPKGTFFKDHAIEAAAKLRSLLKFADNAVPKDVFNDFRSLGLHIFRRRLNNSNISGLFINHPSAGRCILINYTEDIFRQRFTVAHEVAHSIFDTKNEINVSFSKWQTNDLIEIRADTFASNFLLPPLVLRKISLSNLADYNSIVDLALKLKVSTSALATSMKNLELISQEQHNFIKNVKVPVGNKVDPELSGNLSARGLERKKTLLEKGLSSYYVSLCFNAYNAGIISASRIAEMLLISERELVEISKLYNIEFYNGN
ncbi:MAG: XRE family transcriptional regulator [archaeon]